nr:hypothetical protein [Tanacetum cinerariifolium]
QGEDLIECINNAMAFMSGVALRFPPSNNQLKTSSNPRIKQPFKMVGSQSNKFKEDNIRVMLCTQPKRPRNAAWFKEKLMLADVQEAGQILDEEQLAFLADPGISKASLPYQTIP